MKELIVMTLLTLGTVHLWGQLPKVVLKDIDGKDVEVAKLRNDGKPFIIDFFATWCKPCNRELDAISEVYDDWQRETGVKLVAVSIDQAQNIHKVKPLADSHGWEFDILLDPNGELQRALGVQMIPYVLVVDGNGNIVYRHNGYTDGEEAELLSSLSAVAQVQRGVSVAGSIQSDVLVPQRDESIGAERTGDFLCNTYAEVLLQSKGVDAGVRLEYLEHPLPGFEQDFKGWGVPNVWVKGRWGNRVELTAGTFYEQFGSGFILRTYEERSLGIDNSLLGVRAVVRPVEGITLKALAGNQRRYWHWNRALVSGADAEVGMEEFIPALQESDTRVTLGASWVNKHEGEEERVFLTPLYRIRFPKYVNAWDVRMGFHHGAWNGLAEYAQKGADPSFANGYIYRRGTAVLLSGSYSKKGLSVLLQTKRSENMSFKSTNDPSKSMGISSAINHLPAFTQDQTYTLAALYPYATQLADGEWAYQAEVGCKVKRNTALGGRYGMNMKVNFSYVRAIDRRWYEGDDLIERTNGYTSSFFKWGDQTYYQDFDVTLSRRLTKALQLTLMYMNQRYNQTVVEGEGGMVNSDIFIAEGKCRFAPKTTLRGELQYLTTKGDQGDWAYGMLELSLVPHWMLTVGDLWNCGETDRHYYQGAVTCNWGQHRLQVGYGRTRAGYNCSGGVCRYVPASKGFTLSYHYNF